MHLYRLLHSLFWEHVWSVVFPCRYTFCSSVFPLFWCLPQARSCSAPGGLRALSPGGPLSAHPNSWTISRCYSPLGDRHTFCCLNRPSVYPYLAMDCSPARTTVDSHFPDTCRPPFFLSFFFFFPFRARGLFGRALFCGGWVDAVGFSHRHSKPSLCRGGKVSPGFLPSVLSAAWPTPSRCPDPLSAPV